MWVWVCISWDTVAVFVEIVIVIVTVYRARYICERTNLFLSFVSFFWRKNNFSCLPDFNVCNRTFIILILTPVRNTFNKLSVIVFCCVFFFLIYNVQFDTYRNRFIAREQKITSSFFSLSFSIHIKVTFFFTVYKNDDDKYIFSRIQPTIHRIVLIFSNYSYKLVLL